MAAVSAAASQRQNAEIRPTVAILPIGLSRPKRLRSKGVLRAAEI